MKRTLSKIGMIAYAISVILMVALIVSLSADLGSANCNLILGYVAFTCGIVGIGITSFIN
ncbi:MAG: hypothetical protein MJZ98_00440 [Paludibacteraceae bacterium]|nr:hypothetical protein [Paludibacteraceae bacterium]